MITKPWINRLNDAYVKMRSESWLTKARVLFIILKNFSCKTALDDRLPAEAYDLSFSLQTRRPRYFDESRSMYSRVYESFELDEFIKFMFTNFDCIACIPLNFCFKICHRYLINCHSARFYQSFGFR